MPTALITGASSGIGETFARALAKRKTDVLLVARSAEKLKALATELQTQHGIRAVAIAQDLVAPGAAQAVLEAVTHQGMEVDMLINNAGFGDYGAFCDRSLQKQLDMIQLNVSVLVALTYLFLPGMRQRRSGSIINVASIAAFQPIPYLSVYAATKAFVLSFSEALWAENSPYGIYVQALCPGPTKTQFFQAAEFPEPQVGGDSGSRSASAEQVVRESLEGMEKGVQTVVAGGLGNQVIANLSRFFPRDALVKVLEKQFRGNNTSTSN